jgi:hypothetical protein
MIGWLASPLARQNLGGDGETDIKEAAEHLRTAKSGNPRIASRVPAWKFEVALQTTGADVESDEVSESEYACLTVSG